MPYLDEDKYCYFKCEDPAMEYKKYYCKTGSLEVAVTHEEIQENILKNGPVMVGLTVYEDFYNYESGIYH